MIIVFAPLFLWISSTHFVSQTLLRLVEKPWEQKTYESIEKGNAIVVLSGGLHPNSKKRIIAEWSDPDRFFSGIKLFKKGEHLLNFYLGLDHCSQILFLKVKYILLKQ